MNEPPGARARVALTGVSRLKYATSGLPVHKVDLSEAPSHVPGTSRWHTHF